MKILVVDDEALARQRLLRLLGEVSPEHEVLEASDGHSAIVTATREKPDLVLLDVRMPGMDGIEVAASLDELHEPPAVAFCTAYDEYALQALKHHAIAYLLKPVRKDDLRDCLQSAGRINRVQLGRLREPMDADDRYVSSHTHQGLETLPLQEICCFLAEQKHVSAVSTEQTLILSDTLKELEERFGDTFVRVHRNALVALDHIERLSRRDDGSWEVVIHGLELRPAISRRHLSPLKKRLSR